MNIDDSYKFMSWTCRYIAASAFGATFGDIGTDESIGRAASEIRPASEIAAMHPYANIVLHMMAGGWSALKVADKPNAKGGKKDVPKGQQD